MRPEDFQARFAVTPETMDKLKVYHALLLKWQKAINLVSGSTLDEAWERHFADSAQLAAHIPAGVKTLVDLGSGAGFPGLVLGILRPDLETHLIESDERKTQFLKSVSRETGVKVIAHDRRIEDAAPGLRPDLVTARALASLEELFGHCAGWAAQNPALEMLFLKGQGADVEVEAARQAYDFDLRSAPSITSPAARILHISGLRRSS